MKIESTENPIVNNVDFHNFVRDFREKKVSLYIDPSAARNFFCDGTHKLVTEEVGLPMFFHVMIVRFFLICGYLSLFTSIIMSYMAFGLWGFLATPVAMLLFMNSHAISSLGRRTVLPPTFALIAVLALFYWLFPAWEPWQLVIVFLLLSLFLIRACYNTSIWLVITLATDNPGAYGVFKEAIEIHPN